MSLSSFVSFGLLGFVAGIFSGLFGIGGGIIIVPALIYFWKFPQSMASATSLAVFLLPIGALGVFKYYKEGLLHGDQILYGLIIGAGMILGSPWGARLAMALPALWTQRAFSVLLFLVALKMWNKTP